MKYDCEKCHDTGFILYEKYMSGLPYTYAQECPFCRGKEKAEKIKRSAEIPTEMYNAKIEDFDWTVYRTDDLNVIDTSDKQKTINDILSHYPEWSKEGWGLYICSHTKGSGKTFLASAIANTLMERYNVKVKFVSASDLIRLDQEREFDPYADRYTVSGIEKLLTVDLLVIDDLGVGNAGTGWREDILYRIIDKRKSNKKPIIFTSNAWLDELEVDDRITDRINDDTMVLTLPEVRVRANKAAQRKRKFLKSRGIIE